MHHISIYDTDVPHVSRFKLKKHDEEQLIRSLDVVLTKLSKEEELSGFLSSLLSPTERLMLAKRLAIIVLLKEGFSQVDISRALHITRETVSRMQLLHEAKGEGYELALKKLDEEKSMLELKKLLINIARYSIRAAGGYVKPTIF
ncbi:MAG: helix-turn-helix domain-containing protein [Candidatus Levybacteria bacterium]|nr:helix-turn-helix domain-containing protein [Candidatus Levybacteria bacterium]